MDPYLDLCEHQVAQPGTLYVVATPIGNLGDITLRAIQILRTCDCIACETPRTTLGLLSALKISGKALFTYRDEGEEKSAQHLLERLQQGQSVALVSDAGTPIISDPGYRLTKLCQERHVPIVPIPGASAAISALSISGFPSHQFVFLGFLPIKKGHKMQILKAYHDFKGTLIIYESPFRIRKLLELLKTTYTPKRLVFIARELTKLNESFYRGTLDTFNQTSCPEKGEYVVLIGPED